ncbi:hypothetical protein JNW90_12220 [Micromonospora sp. STR1s_5]|nr:hypothetical protein [Micromonospora sp. STR1s_5]
MRDADTPPQEPADRLNTRPELTPRQQAALIRSAAAEVRQRVQEWRNSLGWQDTPTNAYRHQATVVAVAALDALPEPATDQELAGLVDAVRPVLAEWRPSRPGPEQQIFIAVERLQKACG